MRVTVCQFPDAAGEVDGAWDALARHSRAAGTDLLLLPEMPFHPWLFDTPRPDPRAWAEAVDAHHRWLGRLGETGAGAVAASRPATRDGRRFHEAFVWIPGRGTLPAHDKRYLPDQAGTYEASWYERGDGTFSPIAAADALIGFLMCTELWFPEHARRYGSDGVQIVAAPRATEPATTPKWIAAGRTAAVISGAFCLSSNRSGSSPAGDWGGAGWVISPDGDLLALTSDDEPFTTIDVDLGTADLAKTTFPRSVDSSADRRTP